MTNLHGQNNSEQNEITWFIFEIKKKKQAGITFIPHNNISIDSCPSLVERQVQNIRYSTYYVVGFYKPNIISDVEKLTWIK